MNYKNFNNRTLKFISYCILFKASSRRLSHFAIKIKSCELDGQISLADKDAEAGNNAAQNFLPSVTFPWAHSTGRFKIQVFWFQVQRSFTFRCMSWKTCSDPESLNFVPSGCSLWWSWWFTDCWRYMHLQPGNLKAGVINLIRLLSQKPLVTCIKILGRWPLISKHL